MSPAARQLEAMLFATAEAVPFKQLATALEIDVNALTPVVEELRGGLADHGLALTAHHDTLRLVTAPDTAAAIERLLGAGERLELSKAALETLAIVAYRGPLTKNAIEEIRGVSSDTMLRNLMQRGLVMEQGRSSEPGRPQLYSVSHRFLEHFGLTGTHDLPPLPPAETA